MVKILNIDIIHKFYLSRFSFDQLIFSSFLLILKNTLLFINQDDALLTFMSCAFE